MLAGENKGLRGPWVLTLDREVGGLFNRAYHHYFLAPTGALSVTMRID